ncbi:MAG: prolyl oligopeptidase family serine peptidase, partial [Acidimicrobiia bacterium]|nr:prolyl oligopeptidase family serine peptidase [Acidimicrobiia bacterium]
DVVLDLDALAEAEDENWVWKGAVVNADYSKGLVQLSRGGKDATVIREFDLVAKRFVTEGTTAGFTVPEAKTFLDWIDDDTILIGTDFGPFGQPGSLTESGYPAVVKRWHRGQSLAEATTVHEIDRSQVLLSPSVQRRPEGVYIHLIALPDFFTTEIHLLDPDSDRLQPVNLAPEVQFQCFFDGAALAILRADWRGHRQGSLVALDLATDALALIHQPDERSSIRRAVATRDAVVVDGLENVVGGLYVTRPGVDGRWSMDRVPLNGLGTVEVVSASDDTIECLVSYNDFLTPPSLLAFTTDDLQPRTLKSQPARFDAGGLVAEQRFTTSADGTQVPYFVVGHRAGPGPKRTLLYGYGGFEVSLTPGYAALTGRLWLERGGVYVVANIRGGGEFGPAWHQAALKQNRHKAYEDFEAVARQLVADGLTTPDRLAIRGGSNGGLLVGATFTRSPNLCAGVICAVPLLDMLRYHLLLAGASWMGEYGDPDDPVDGAYLASYSPFHQVTAEVDYPTVFVVTSTRDDRVHPGHARKMVARMLDQGHRLYYYENTEGGHAAGANLKQQARLAALEYVYLDKVLAD